MEMPRNFKLVATGKNSNDEEIQIVFPVADNFTIDQSYDGFTVTGGLTNQLVTSKSLTVSFNASCMEMSKLTGKESTMSFDYKLIAVRFPMNGKKDYDEKSKLYFYLIKNPNEIQIGDFIYANYGITHRGTFLNEVTVPAFLPYYDKALRVEAVWENLPINVIQTMLEKHGKNYIIEFSDYTVKINDRLFTKDFVESLVIEIDEETYNKIGYYISDGDKGCEINGFNALLSLYQKANTSKTPAYIDKINEAVKETPLIEFKNGSLFKVNKDFKEEKSMNMKKLMGDFVFGKLNTNEVKYSFNGIAFRTSDGTYNVYNEDGSLTNVSNMVMDIPIFAMPVSKAQLAVGDVILHPADRTPLVVKENAETAIITVEPKTNEIKTFAPQKSIFGFDFYTKILTPTDMFSGANADTNNPFGNMLPFLMLGNEETDMSTVLMLSMMNKDNNDMKSMLPFFLMKDGKNEDMLMLMALGGFNFGK